MTPEETKRWSTLQARAALAGHTCHLDGAGRIVLARWGRCMAFGSLAQAEAWLARVSGKVVV
ncbi:MAG TPA: hypothetical protein PKC60_03245 [Hydrogenophaga sp.]|uniref:hypothetical protein n=1 Tax=Hydrogenophaga sp. TaxID=1904254 RepID=UPI002C52BCF1|nr:hypothetical protein [Hydrogenophaga sp.]HMN92225.1 hypothetical protein [Hydrogenophaga sp.]HMP11577.1 hypothetical protein [Hydrogenophaga sp.]